MALSSKRYLRVRGAASLRLIQILHQALEYARSRETLYGSIPKCTKAIIFFGTPHQGTDSAVWATYLGKLGKSIGLRSTQVTEELQRWSDPLVELTTTFSQIAPDFQITTFFEKRLTHGVMVRILSRDFSWYNRTHNELTWTNRLCLRARHAWVSATSALGDLKLIISQFAN